MALAWFFVPLVAVAGLITASQLTQATASTAKAISSTSSTTQPPAGPATLTAVTATVAPAAQSAPGREAANPKPGSVTWTVQPGDTLSGIAAALGVRGGWPALYAANRSHIGPNPNAVSAGIVLTVPGTAAGAGPARYTVAEGDTLSGIAAALGVRGGWPALYAANRSHIGPSPDALRPGTVLIAPGPSASATPSGAPTAGSGTTPSAPSAPSAPAAPPAPRTAPVGTGTGTAPASPVSPRTAPSSPGSLGSSTAPAGHPAASGASAGIMPAWLKATLLGAALLTVLAFLAEPAVILVRRRRTGVAAPHRAPSADGLSPEHPSPDGRSAHRSAAAVPTGETVPAAEAVPTGETVPASEAVPAAEATASPSPVDQAARIIEASYERLIVTYCTADHTIYLLSPPGEDPRTVLRAARLVVPEPAYQELAGHLGVSPAWPGDG